MEKNAETKEYKLNVKSAKVFYKEAQYELSKEKYIAAIKSLENTDREFIATKNAKILLKIAVIHWKQGKYKLSMIDLEEGRKLLVKIDQFETCLGAEILSTLSILKKVQSELSEAENLALEAIDIMKKLNLPNHITMAKILLNYGWVLDEMAKYSDAFKILKESLEIQLKYEGKDKLDQLGSCYNRIGGVLEHQGKIIQANGYYLKALECKIQYYGCDIHPEVADMYNNIGNIDETLYRYGSALKNYNKFLETYIKFHGKEHPKIADAYLNIGCIFDNLERYPQALESYSKSLELDIKFFGETHPRIAETLGNMGCVFLNMERFLDALRKYRKSMDIYLKFYNPRHPKAADTYYNLGMLLTKVNDVSSSKALFLKYLASHSEMHGKEGNDFAQIKNLVYRYELMEAQYSYNSQINLD